MSSGKSSNDAIVVSGISGRFPNANNVQEFSHNLYNKVDMSDDKESRWKNYHPDVPNRSGKIHNLEKFDASFFSILGKNAHQTDPQARILLETAYEAILDAGVSPQSLIGSRTGVFIGNSLSDAKDAYITQIPSKDGYSIFGNANFYLSNRISYALGLTGPSFTLDTACSSSAYALDCAYKYIQSGACDAALVGGSHLVLSIRSTVEYTKTGVLAVDGISRPFDQHASGFSRADAIAVLFLQREKDSKRVYAKLLHTHSNNDGFKKEGSSFPSRVMQQKLMEEFFLQAKIDPSCVNFVEAHSTGTKLGDPEEVAAIDAVFCKNKNRTKALPIGSVKSNIGHAEASSAVASIAKILLTLENQKIPPNINITHTKNGVAAFDEGRLRVVTEVEDLDGPFISMNSFGLGGANAHAMFQGNLKTKINDGLPKDDLGRMVLWSGRTEDAVKAIFEDLSKRPLDAEHVALLQNSQVQTSTANVYRGYGLFTQDPKTEKAICTHQNIQLFTTERRPVVWVYTGMGSQWAEMGTDLLTIPLFRKTIEKCHDILLPKGLNLIDIITSPEKSTFDQVLHSYVGIVAIEIALTDLLKSLGLEPDYIVGHSVGELGCAYADNCFTAEETILAAYSRGKANTESIVIAGGMAAIGMNHKEVTKILPSDIDIACHNSIDSTTISGPVESVKAFVQELSAKNVFAREVACSGVPLHSRYISEMGSILLAKLNDVIQNPKKRSEKWLSSTYPNDQWSSDESQYSSAKYHTRNLLSPVLFEEVLEILPKDALTIEIAPHGLLKSILKRSLQNGIHLSLAQRDNKNCSLLLMEALGTIFQNGIDVDIAKLYSPISFPVSRGTPMISPIIKWDHKENYFVPYFDSFNQFERQNLTINVSEKGFEYVQGHIIDGNCLFPGTGWLCLVWETFGMMLQVPQMEMRIVFENVKFMRTTSMQKDKNINVTVMINRSSGSFAVMEGKTIVVEGFIKIDESLEMNEISIPENKNPIMLKASDFYKELRLRGYNHQGPFQGVTEVRDDGFVAKVRWDKNWTTFIDCILQPQVLAKDSRMLVLPTFMRKLVIDAKLHNKVLDQMNGNVKVLDVVACPILKIIKSGGVEVHGFEGNSVNRRRLNYVPVLETYKFVPQFPVNTFSKVDMAKICVQLILQNEPTQKLISVEIDSKDDKEPLSEFIFQGVADLPKTTPQIIYLTSRKVEINNVLVEEKELSTITDANLIIKTNCINDKEFLQTAKSILNGKGFILSRDKASIKDKLSADLKLLAMIPIEGEFVSILQFVNGNFKNPETVIKITSNVNEWLEPLKIALKKGTVIIYSQNEPLSGILGLVNCLQKEPNGDKLKCVLIFDETAPLFDVENPFYHAQLKLGLITNVFQNGKWGNYWHQRLTVVNEKKSQLGHCLANCLVKGDLSTLTWLEGPFNAGNFLNDESESAKDIITVQYASLNFRDIMLATGKLSSDEISKRICQQSILGFEYSGLTNTGRRVMGICRNGGLATQILTDLEKPFIWDVPENWSLEEAATVPLVYFTVYISFFVKSKIQKGNTILIHSGTGGIGLAAIQVALAYGLEVYTTVGSDEKKKFLLDKFPHLNANNIGNSRNTTFEKMVQYGTKGKGVDFVLNSLSDDKLQASLRCLAVQGTFLEIGKYDIKNRTNLNMGYFEKQISFVPVFFLNMSHLSEVSKTTHRLLKEDLLSGVIVPLKANIFEADKIEDAFRSMASGKHIGKVLLKMRENSTDLESLPISVSTKTYYHPIKSYVIVGGLGGFGLELADWLILRGCRKLVLSSSRGISDAYQASKIKLWKSYGVEISINTAEITSKSGCEELIQDAMKLGPVNGIFNLAVALRDGIFENQDSKMFAESLAPKADATRFLDEISRKHCPNLKHFVVFSSVSCGRGNAGQSNYGMANSIMEKVMEQRAELGLPAKAIQWGAIGDVGLLSSLQEKNLEMTIGGTLPQRISNCLEVLDILLMADETIVASMIVAEKNIDSTSNGNILDTIFNIMSIRDKKAISMESSLSRLGMDSLTGVEIQQVLERDYGTVLSLDEMRTITLSQLEKLVHSKVSGEAVKAKSSDDIEFLLTGFGDEKTSNQTILKLQSGLKSKNTIILIVPGMEGMAGEVWHDIAKEMKYPTYILQFGNVTEDCTTLEEMFDAISKDVLDLFSGKEKFHLVGYSFGSLLTLKIAKMLESKGKKGHVTMIDGSQQLLHRSAKASTTDISDKKLQSMIVLRCIQLLFTKDTEQIAKKIFAKATWDEQLDVFAEILESVENKSQYSAVYGRKMLKNLLKRIKIIIDADKIELPTLEFTSISLIKSKTSHDNIDLNEDYELGNFSNEKVNVSAIDGDHATILKNSELLNLLNN